MKVIFLDFDGPIIPMHSHTHRRGEREKAWPPCVAALNRITDATGAKIVVSSSWRYGGLQRVTGYLAVWGVTGEVIDITPQMSTYDKQTRLYRTVIRGEEIKAWLLAAQEPVESFVIFDDDEDMGELDTYLIRTPFECGITEADADNAIGMLGRL